jgi:hypothetical protein
MSDTEIPQDETAVEMSAEEIYQDYGWDSFNSVIATPILIPNTEGTECLLGTNIELKQTSNNKSVLRITIPYEVLFGLISNLSVAALRHGQIISKGSYKVDTQLIKRSRIKQLNSRAITNLQKMNDIVDSVFVDDDMSEEFGDTLGPSEIAGSKT